MSSTNIQECTQISSYRNDSNDLEVTYNKLDILFLKKYIKKNSLKSF